MYEITDKLLLYSKLDDESILMKLGQVFWDWQNGNVPKNQLIHRINAITKELLDISTSYGFDKNLWHDYLSFLLITSENSFSLTCEMKGATPGGSINHIAAEDFRLFLELFNYDFSAIEEDLGINNFSMLTHYTAIPKHEQLYNKDVSMKVRSISDSIEKASSGIDVFDIITDYFRHNGVGLFGTNKAFRVRENKDGLPSLIPITNLDHVSLDYLIGYDIQKEQMRKNVEGFITGTGFNNMLLYGDAGTGKSTSVKALLNDYSAHGLRVIEIYKHQFHMLGDIISTVKNRHYFFMIFIDDLSFEENEVEYKFLKAVIEGGIETRPSNVMICATSNRRHLIKETWNDRNDMEHDGDIHRSDTMEEKLSLAARFGCAVNFSQPTHQQFQDIVRGIAARTPGIDIPEEQLLYEANRWEIRHGGVSGRCAQQFINDISGKKSDEGE